MISGSRAGLLKRVFVCSILGAAAMAARPGTAVAGVISYNYCPSGSCANNATTHDANDLDDLDHHNFYVWRIGNITVNPSTLTGAKLTFTKIYNWDANPNELFLQLFDTAKTSGGTQLQSYNLNSSGGPINSSNYTSAVRYAQDETLDQGPLSDVFNNKTSVECAGLSGTAYTACASKQSSEQTLENTLVSSTTAETKLTARSFADLGTYPTASPGQTNPPGWAWKADGSDASGNPLYTYTYTLTSAQLTALQSYIANDKTIALGLDPDCHFFNDGVMLTLTAGTPIPEPASLLLIGAGVGAALRRRYRRRSTLAA